MAKTILVPIDFQVASLNTLKLALECSNDKQVTVILMYSEFLNDSISDLLFYSPHKIIDQHLTPEFNEALEVLKNRFGDILVDVNIKTFHGKEKNSLNSFLDANHIDEIFLPKTYTLKTKKMAFDPIPLIKKSKVRFFEMEWTMNYNQTEQEHLIALFN